MRFALREKRLTSIPGALVCALETGTLSYGEPRPRKELERIAYEGSKKSWHTWAARQYLALPTARRDQGFRYDVQIWRLGDRLTLFAMEGEICSPWGPALRSMAPTDQALVIGYANCTRAYIPDAQIVREGGYEGDTSHQVYFLPAPFTERIEEEVTAIVQKALDRVSRME